MRIRIEVIGGLLLALAACGQRAPASLGDGAAIYAKHCAACHGPNLEGQPDWRRRRPDGKLPAPPHDATGHTWHHPREQLAAIVKSGLQPPNAPPGYASDMPAFAGILNDEEIAAVLGFIESRWPPEVLQARRERFGAGR